MRITVDDFRRMKHQDFTADACKIYLDGVEVKRCIFADEEAGEVKVYISKDEFCKLQSLRTLDCWPTEIKKGVVKVELYKNGEVVKA